MSDNDDYTWKEHLGARNGRVSGTGGYGEFTTSADALDANGNMVTIDKRHVSGLYDSVTITTFSRMENGAYMRREVELNQEHGSSHPEVNVSSHNHDPALAEVTNYNEINSSIRGIEGTRQLNEAVTQAVDRAFSDRILSEQEAQQFNNLRAYITNHSGDGVLDTQEVATAIARANRIAPEENGR